MRLDDEQCRRMLSALKSLNIRDLDRFFREYDEYIVKDDKPFTGYMRDKFKRKRLSEKVIFDKANISTGYGYKLISGEKKTGQRDVIIRLCMAMRMTLSETQWALCFSGFAGLCPNVRRDIVLISAICNREYDIDIINRVLEEHGLEPMKDVM